MKTLKKKREKAWKRRDWGKERWRVTWNLCKSCIFVRVHWFPHGEVHCCGIILGVLLSLPLQEGETEQRNDKWGLVSVIRLGHLGPLNCEAAVRGSWCIYVGVVRISWLISIRCFGYFRQVIHVFPVCFVEYPCLIRGKIPLTPLKFY